MKKRIQATKELLDILLEKKITGNAIPVDKYPHIVNQITDDLLFLRKPYLPSNLELISNRFEPYLGEYGIEPIIGIDGGNVICIGARFDNWGEIFYFDFDFGMFRLDSCLNSFLEKLILVDLDKI